MGDGGCGFVRWSTIKVGDRVSFVLWVGDRPRKAGRKTGKVTKVKHGENRRFTVKFDDGSHATYRDPEKFSHI